MKRSAQPIFGYFRRLCNSPMSVASNLNASPIISSREILKCILTYVVFSGVSKLSTRGGQQIILSDSLLDHLPSRFCSSVGATPFSILLIVTSSLGILRANRRLSTTCHEFREVLLPAIYGNVHFSKGLDFKRLTTSFLELGSLYGHHCYKLSIPVPRRGPVHALLQQQLYHFVNLEILDLQFPESGDTETCDDWKSRELH